MANVKNDLPRFQQENKSRLVQDWKLVNTISRDFLTRFLTKKQNNEERFSTILRPDLPNDFQGKRKIFLYLRKKQKDFPRFQDTSFKVPFAIIDHVSQHNKQTMDYSRLLSKVTNGIGSSSSNYVWYFVTERVYSFRHVS